MDSRLLFTQRALNEIAEIIGWIAEDDPKAAERFGSSLLDHIELLTRFPRMGTAVAKRPGVRKLSHSPILVYYQFRQNDRTVEILHLRHASRKPAKW